MDRSRKLQTAAAVKDNVNTKNTERMQWGEVVVVVVDKHREQK